MSIFIIQGCFLGIIGIVLGIILGCLFCYNLDYIVQFIEYILGYSILDSDIYMISKVPAEIRILDIIFISLTSFIFSLLATLYPSINASRTKPAEVLKGN